MKKSYMPNISAEQYCDGIDLCTVRKSPQGESQIFIASKDEGSEEKPVEAVLGLQKYMGKKIARRVYASGHVFLSEDNQQVFLVSTQSKKDSIPQHQFTGGSPLEEEYKNIIIEENGVYKFDVDKARENARLRAKIRTGVTILEEWNSRDSLVDWIMKEYQDKGKSYYKLICLMHFVVKKYQGELWFTGKEHTVGGGWFRIDELESHQGAGKIAPNAVIVCREAVEMLGD